MKTMARLSRAWLALGFAPGVLPAQIVTETNVPIGGAKVYYERARKFVATRQVGKRPVSWAPAEPSVSGVLNAASNGAVSFPALPDGDYTFCVGVPGGGFLDPCQWGAPPRFTVKQGRPSAIGSVRLRRGAVLRIRVNDPQRLLPPASNISISRLIVGVRTSAGAFHSAGVVSEDPAGRDLALTIPFDTPLKLWVFSRDLKVTDSLGRAVDTTGANLPLQAPAANPEVRFTFQVSGTQ